MGFRHKAFIDIGVISPAVCHFNVNYWQSLLFPCSWWFIQLVCMLFVSIHEFPVVVWREENALQKHVVHKRKRKFIERQYTQRRTKQPINSIMTNYWRKARQWILFSVNGWNVSAIRKRNNTTQCQRTAMKTMAQQQQHIGMPIRKRMPEWNDWKLKYNLVKSVET